MNKSRIAIFSVSVSCLLLSSCNQESPLSGSEAPKPVKYEVPKSFDKDMQISLSEEQLKQMNFSTVTAKHMTIPVEVEASGEIEINPQLATPAVSLVAGRIESVNVQIGDTVAKGKVLARLRSNDVAQIEADLLKTILEFRGEQAQLEADNKFATATCERKQLLFKEGIGSKADLQAAETELAKSSAALESLGYKRKAAIDSTTERLTLFGLPHSEVERLLQTGEVDNSFDIVSPRAGIITERQVDPGQTISTSDKLFEVSDLSQVWLQAQVFEKDISSMRKGEPVTVVVDALQGKTFKGKVDFVGNEVDEKSRTLPVRANVDNQRGLLKPNMFARLIVRTAQERFLAVPQKAVQRIGEADVVYVVVAPHTYQERQVKIGRTLGDSIEVKSGLKDGELVVTDGSLQLEGLAIEQGKQ